MNALYWYRIFEQWMSYFFWKAIIKQFQKEKVYIEDDSEDFLTNYESVQWKKGKIKKAIAWRIKEVCTKLSKFK